MLLSVNPDGSDLKILASGDSAGNARDIHAYTGKLYWVTWSGEIKSSNLDGTGTFTVRFSPVVSGAKSATLQLFSNDADESPFDIGLGGQALSAADDSDGDRLNDLAEFRMALLGFNWEIAQFDLVAALRDNSALCGLYSEGDLRNIHPGSLLLKVSDGTVTIDLLMQKSDDMQTWEAFGDPVQWVDPAAGDKAIYRLLYLPPP